MQTSSLATPPAGSRVRGTCLALVVLLPLLVYLTPQRYCGSGDTAPAELLPIALLHHHGFNLREFADPHKDLPYYLYDAHGRIISEYPVLPGLMNFPVYLAAHLLHVPLFPHRFALSLITASLVTTGSVVFLFLTLLNLTGDNAHSLAFSLLYAFGTNAWSTGAITLFQHGTSLLFLTAAFYFLSSPVSTRAAWAGLALAFAVANRPTNIIFALVLTVFVLIHRRKAIAGFVALAAIPAILLGVYSHLYWGSIFALGQGQGGWGFNGNMLAGLAGLLVSPARGIFIFSPIFVFSVLEGVRRLRHKSGESLPDYLFVATILLVLLYTKWGNWWGGHSFSYRLLTEISPVMIILASSAWRFGLAKKPLARRAFIAAAAISVFVQALGASSYPSTFNDRIDTEPQRLWNWKETEITMDVAKDLVRVGLRKHALLVHHLTPDGAISPSDRPPFHVWWTWANNDSSIPGWCDSPHNNAVVHGQLVVAGWAKSVSGDVEVRVILDNGQRVAVPGRYPRPDVAMTFPHLGDTSHAGWRVTWPYHPGGASTHEITVELRATNGSVRTLPPIRFQWLP